MTSRSQRGNASITSVLTAVGLLSASIGGGIYVGAIANEVQTLEEEVKKVEDVQQDLHDVEVKLTAVITRQEFMLQEQAKQDKKLDKIIDKLEEQD